MESLPSEQRKRILVVEDDLELREQILVPDLTEMGFDVQGAGSALEMYRYLMRSEVDAVVLDVGLPDEDGFSALTHLRRSADIAVVLLTGRSGSADQIRGLDGGADAYLVKPVETEVLAATLRSVLRRRGATSAKQAIPAVLNAYGWDLALDGWRLTSPERKQVQLSHAELLFLAALMRKPGSAISREDLSQNIVAELPEFDPFRLEMVVHRLRRKVEEGCQRPLPVRSIRSVGYAWTP
ncbi:response regulator transcription factor [Stenotrophomonas rhizophila]